MAATVKETIHHPRSAAPTIQFRWMCKTETKRKIKLDSLRVWIVWFGGIYATRSIKTRINNTIMKLLKKQNKRAHGETAMISNKLSREQVNGVCTVRSKAEHRCTFDMLHRYTINIFGLGWRACLGSIACDCNRWSTPFLQNIPTPPQVSSSHPSPAPPHPPNSPIVK